MLSEIQGLNFKKISIKLLAIIFILTLMFNTNVVKSGLEEEQRKLAQYKAQLEQIKKNIVSIDNSTKEINSLIDSLSDEVSYLKEEIKKTQQKIDELNAQIKVKEIEIKNKEEEIAKRQKDLEEAVNLSYKLTAISPIELLYEGNDPESVYKRITYIGYISDYTKKLMEQAEQDKLQLQKFKSDLSKSEKEYEAVLKEKQEQENILLQEIDMKNRLLETLKQKKTYLLYKQSELEEEIKKEEELIQKLIEEQRKKGIYAGTFIWPVIGPVTSEFGMRFHPILHIMRMHDGIDIAVPTGTPVKASASGTIIATKWLEGYGNVVIVSHGQNFSTLYAHLKSFAVKEGQEVKQGQVIAYSDNTGWSTGPHLHFSIYKIDPETGKSMPVNPRNYLP
ncbi:murein hydrolase activator EnvC family protein [Caldisericum exile]|uniref:Peptidase M23 family protein n=1 Tax=Caldisericum exile (strain DSM 21853 / NBRC 104410 / AZM16c01) TaxID=511051 RepID=A0A7U6GF47_CALEA|nr:M23 family metallopeptidase [Caldisericum exile]BAL81177.1 peptidase M23 family protein [Caldisericum exile AZM16c01]